MSVLPARLVTTLPGFHQGRRIDVIRYPGTTLLSVHTDDALTVHDLATVADDTPAVFPSTWPSCPTAVSPSRELAVFCGTHALRAVDASGRIRWEHRHACWAWRCQESHHDEAEYAGDSNHRSPDCGSARFSTDGRLVWAHVRTGITLIDAHKASPRHAWLVFDAATGEVLASTEVTTFSPASAHIAHPDADRMGLDDDYLFWGHFDGTALHVEKTAVEGMVTATGPSGEHFLTIDESQSSLNLHRAADGKVLGSVAPPRFAGVSKRQAEEDSDYESRWRWAPTFLDATTILAPTNERDVLDRPDRHWIVDVPSMRIRGHVTYPEATGDRLAVLGEGRWLTYRFDLSALGLRRAPAYDSEAGRPRVWELG